ncbi:MAG: Calx-beta domain-containing protein [Thiotrichaceae bacterium]
MKKYPCPVVKHSKFLYPLPGREDGQTRRITMGLTSVKKAQIAFDSDKLTVDEFGEMTTIDGKTGSFISIPVMRSNNSKGKVVVNYAIEAGTALANQDYYVENDKGTLTWEDGENFNQSISLMILDDTLLESPESFSVNLTGLSIEDNSVAELGTPKKITVTIRDNDGAQCQKNETLALQPSEKTVTLEMGSSPFTFSLSGGQGKIDIFTPPDGEIAKALLEAEGNQANVTLFPIEVGETQLILEDCAGSQSRITISVKSQSTTTETDGNVAQCLEDPTLALTPAFQEVTLVLGEAPITLTVSGGQKERTLSVAPDSTIVTASVPNFPEKAGASITFSGRKVGKTELVFSDCYSQASIKVNVVKQLCETTAERVLQPASHDITILLEQTDATTVLMTGGQGERWLSTAPDNKIVSAGNPIFLATGGGSITLMPKAIGQTKLVITDDCGDFAVANINVVSTHSLAHYCAMANEQRGICESPDAQVQLPPLALEEDVFGTLFTTMANFHYRGIQENRVSSETLSALAVDMFVDPTHVGKAASLLLVARLTEGKYNQVYDGTNWRDLPKGEVAIEELPVLIEQPSLPSVLVLREQIIKPLTTLMNSGSGAEIFFGYRLKEKGIVVYNGMYPLLILSPNNSVMSATGGIADLNHLD